MYQDQKKQASCLKCPAGRYGAKEDSKLIDACNFCPKGWKRAETDIDI